MAEDNHYSTLGVTPDADTPTITRAFRKLARSSHPDLNADSAASARFKAVAEAYAVLRNPSKRAAYDRPAPTVEPSASTPWGRRHASPQDREMADLLAAFARRAPAGEAAHTSSPPLSKAAASSPEKGGSHQRTLHLSLRDAHMGTQLRLSMPRTTTLHDHSAGPSPRHLDVTIPPGTSHGQVMRLRGQGDPGRSGGPAGDVLLHIAVLPDPVFTVDGHDLYMALVLTPWQAVLGDEITVMTLDGPVLLTVPPGTGRGRTLRLRGRGLCHGPVLSNGARARGNLYARTHIDVPPQPSPQEQALYRQLAEEASASVSAQAEAIKSGT
jgi:curved DNA-binding protein